MYFYLKYFKKWISFLWWPFDFQIFKIYLNFVYINLLHFYLVKVFPTSSPGVVILLFYHFKTDVFFKSVKYLTRLNFR